MIEVFTSSKGPTSNRPAGFKSGSRGDFILEFPVIPVIRRMVVIEK